MFKGYRGGSVGTQAVGLKPARSSPRLSPVAPETEKPLQRALIILGLALLVAGLLWPWLARLPLGRLPGDIVIEREGFRLFFPITSMVLVSLVLSLVLWLFRR